jgi:hypothetical protein
MDTKLTIEQIESLLVGYADSPFYIRKNIVVPNCSWGFLNHEADLLIMSKSGYLTEVEIKRSWSDFKADFQKNHTHNDKHIAHLYYAVPVSIGEKVFKWLYDGEYKVEDRWLTYCKSKVNGYTENNPNKCGLILYADCDVAHPRGNIGINVPAALIGNYACNDKDTISLLRLGNMRIWNLKKKLAEYQVESYLFKNK